MDNKHRSSRLERLSRSQVDVLQVSQEQTRAWWYGVACVLSVAVINTTAKSNLEKTVFTSPSHSGKPGEELKADTVEEHCLGVCHQFWMVRLLLYKPGSSA